jgi:hypothetical protein
MQITIAAPHHGQNVGLSNPWTEYVKMLPGEVPVPTMWSEEERIMLVGTSLEVCMRRPFCACLGITSSVFMSVFQNGHTNHGDEKIVLSFDGSTEKRSRSRLTWRAMEAKIRRLLTYFESAPEVVDNDF